jgi:hypothetical protein
LAYWDWCVQFLKPKNMNKKTKIADSLIELSTAPQNLSIEIVTYQNGEIIRTSKGVSYTEKIERQFNELRFNFEIDSTIQWSKQIGKFIDVLLASNKLKIATNKIYTNKLDLNFEIHFNGKTFNGSQFLQVKPNFFNSATNLNKFYIGLTLFFGSLTGEFEAFSYSKVSFTDAVNGTNKVTEKTYNKSEAHKIGHKPLKLELINLN